MINNQNSSVIYHGSPIKINDNYFASETYFTDDLGVAKNYGKFVYSIEVDEKIKSIMELDCFKEHFISTRLIPTYLFTIKEY